MRVRRIGEKVRQPMIASLFALTFLASLQNRVPATGYSLGSSCFKVGRARAD